MTQRGSIIAYIVFVPFIHFATEVYSHNTHWSFEHQSSWPIYQVDQYIIDKVHDENVPKDVTHVIVDDSVTIIKEEAFKECIHLVSVIMVNNVKNIERYAFYYCIALRCIRLSKTLEYIGLEAFC